MTTLSKEDLDEQAVIIQLGVDGLLEVATSRGWSRDALRKKVASVKLLHVDSFREAIENYACPLEAARLKVKLERASEAEYRKKTLFEGMTTNPKTPHARVKAKRGWPSG